MKSELVGAVSETPKGPASLGSEVMPRSADSKLVGQFRTQGRGQPGERVYEQGHRRAVDGGEVGGVHAAP